MKTIFITGATSGIGLVTATELAAKGNTVIATARTIEGGRSLLANYRTKYPEGKGSIEIVVCDLSSFESIMRACTQVKLEHTHIDVLINNAGVWNFKYRETHNHIEETLQVNVLAPLLINYLLLELLEASTDAKSIFAASALHQGSIDFSNLENEDHFSGFNAYRQSKLEVILLCRILAKKFERLNIAVYCEHPGLVNTHLGRDANWFSNLFFRLFGSSPEKGARTLIYLAEENKKRLKSGEYYYKKEIKHTTKQTYDLHVAEQLLDRLELYLMSYVSSPSPIFTKPTKLKYSITAALNPM